MTEQAEKFAVVLYELKAPAEQVHMMAETFAGNPELTRVLASPVVTREKKYRILEQVLAKMEIRDEEHLFLHFLCKVCDDGCITEIDDVFKAWLRYKHQQEGVLEAELLYVTEPEEDQQDGVREFLRRTYDGKEVLLHVEPRPELLGGFVLKTGDVEYDYSLAGRMRKLRRAVVEQQA